MTEKIKVNFIVAVGKQNQIGLNGKVPWMDDPSFSEIVKLDMINFRGLTKNTVCVCGYNTYPSVKHIKGTLHRKLIIDQEDIHGYLYRKWDDYYPFEYAKYKNSVDPTFPLTVSIIGGNKTYERYFKHMRYLNEIFGFNNIEVFKTIIPYDGPADTYFTGDSYNFPTTTFDLTHLTVN